MVRDRELTKKFIQKATPFGDLRGIRSCFLDFLKGIYLDDPFVQNSFDKWDTPTLVEKASHSSQQARKYNPHQEVEAFVAFLDSISRKINLLLAILLLITVYAGLESRAIVEPWFSTGISLLTFLPSTVVAILVLYLGLLRLNSTAMQTFNENMSVPESTIHQNSRNRPNLVSFYVWNISLMSQRFPLF